MSLIEYELETSMVICDECNGVGTSIESLGNGFSDFAYSKTCKKCNGTGKTQEKIKFINIELENNDEK